MWTGTSGKTGTVDPKSLSLSERLRTYGTTDIARIQPVYPTQQAPLYPGQAIGSVLGEFDRRFTALTTGPQTQFNFQAQPMAWQNIQAREISARAAADESLGFNEANMSRWESMAKELTRIDVDTRMSMLDQFVPDWRQKRDAASAINDKLMRGEIPKDVADQLQRSAAYAAVIQGGGAGVQRSLTARDIGATSMELQQRGMQGAQSWTQMMAGLMPEQTTAAGVMATQGMTPQMALEASIRNAENQLTAAQENARGRLDAAYKTQDIGLRAESARAQNAQNWAQLRTGGLTSWMEGLTKNLSNEYGAAMNTSAILFGNIWRQRQEQQERLGLQQGQRQRTGFGL
jgi:hypothetical protein